MTVWYILYARTAAHGREAPSTRWMLSAICATEALAREFCLHHALDFKECATEYQVIDNSEAIY